MRVGVARGAAWAATPPTLIVEAGYFTHPTTNSGHTYDIDPDGHRFLMLKPSGLMPPPQITVVINWFEELKRLMPTN